MLEARSYARAMHIMHGDRTRATSRSARILIVEDELLLAWHLESLVLDLNHKVCGLIPDGDSAIKQAADGNPDLVLMDVRLAGRIDGIETARIIREQRGTPVIFITAHGDEATRETITRIVPGAPVLAKPVSSEQLRNAITSLLG
jgi:DNA-binding response OmpR family regulator